MQDKKAILGFVFLTVIASGCIGGSADGSIDINSLQVNPSEIHEGDNVRVQLDVSNNGLRTGNVSIGENGREVLDRICSDIFEIDSFSASATGRPSLDVTDGDSHMIEPGHDLRLDWVLQSIGDVPLHGQRCSLDFSIPFDYSVSAFKQLQIKENPDVDNINLDQRSSSGPLDIYIEAVPGSTGQENIFIATEDEREIDFTVTIVNQQPSENDPTRGVGNIDPETIEIEASDPIDINSEEHCEVPDRIEIFDGESQPISCSVPKPDRSDLDGPSQISELSVDLDYTFVRDAGQRTIGVNYRE